MFGARRDIKVSSSIREALRNSSFLPAAACDGPGDERLLSSNTVPNAMHGSLGLGGLVLGLTQYVPLVRLRRGGDVGSEVVGRLGDVSPH